MTTLAREYWLESMRRKPEIGEGYISTGSLYLCATVFMPLGLPATDRFWADADAPWTACKAWSGQAFPIDKSL